MSFDLDAFEQADLRARTARVPVPALARWFADGAPAEFEVRGLSRSIWRGPARRRSATAAWPIWRRHWPARRDR